MLRLAHRLLSRPMTSLRSLRKFSEHTASQIDCGVSPIKGSPVIIADNVAAYMCSAGLLGKMIDLSELPPSAPPFQKFFIECKPTCLCGECRDNKSNVIQHGISVTAFWKEGVQKLVDQGTLAAEQGKETGWFLVGFMFATLKSGEPVYTGEWFHISIDKSGKVLNLGDGDQPHYAGYAGILTILTLGFMQCKNVMQVDVTESEGPGRKWCRRQHVPELSYRVLKIEQTGKKSGRQCAGVTDDRDRSGKALHICRGHFKTYAEGGPGLFGTGRTGTFWVPSHTRGDEMHGIRVKDYSVSPAVPANSI